MKKSIFALYLLCLLLIISVASCKKETSIQTESQKPVYLFIEIQKANGTVDSSQVIKL